MTIRRLSTASYGFSELVLRGGISQSPMVQGILSPDAFTVGVKREFGARILQRLQLLLSDREKSIGQSISLMVVSFVLINTQPAQEEES